MTKMKDGKRNDNYFKVFISIAIVLLILSVAFPFSVNYFFTDWSKSGTFGDTFGALNALFSGLALAGIVVTIIMQKQELGNQQIELRLQRTEMQATRKEFLINRATNIVYKQLERFEKHLNSLVISNNGVEYIGNDAISFLDDEIKMVYKSYDMTDEQYSAEKKVAIINLIKLCEPNKSQIRKFAHNAYNSVEALKRLVYKTELEVAELNDLKNLFFVNVGFNNMQFIENISDYTNDEFKFLVVVDYEHNDIDVGVNQRANIFFKSIREFYRLGLTEANFEKEKMVWQESLGSNR